MTKRFIDFIQNKDAASFQEAFEEVVSQKVYAVLEAAKKEVAQDMFNEGGFTGVVTHGNVTKGWPAPPKAGASKLPEEMCKHCGKDPCECEEEEEVKHGKLNEFGSPKHPEAQKLHSYEVVKTKFPNTFKDTTADADARHKDMAQHHNDRYGHVSGHSKTPSQKERMKYIVGRKTEVPSSYIVHKEEHAKKHGKLHHKMSKKMMKLAHKHSKKHHEEEE